MTESRRTSSAVGPIPTRARLEAQRAAGSMASYYGLTMAEYERFRWRWCVADWRHRGLDEAIVEQGLRASPLEQSEILRQFPGPCDLWDALSAYAAGREAPCS